MQCPFCHEEVGRDEDLQLHCLVNCRAAFADPGTNRQPRVESVGVRFRWVKERPCIEREVYLISSLAGSVTLHWKESESLYESETTEVPVGQHTCQLVIGGDVHPTEEFEVNDGSDVIFIIVKEDFLVLGHANDSGTSNRISSGDTAVSDNEPLLIDTGLDAGFRATQSGNSNEMSPLYRELLRHQISHGEPSWVPGSGVQSPVTSEGEGDEPHVLTIRSPYVDELRSSSPVPLRPRLDLEICRPGESDGGLFLPDEGTFDELGVERAQRDLPTSEPGPPFSSSPVPSSHSNRDGTIASLSGSSPTDSVLSELGMRDGLLNENPHPGTGNANALTEESTTIIPSTVHADHPGEEDYHITTTPVSRGDAVEPSLVGMQSPPTGDVQIPGQSSSRASPLGSVLDAVSPPVRGSDLVISNLHTPPEAFVAGSELAASSPERTSPAGSVQSSSLFSSGLPSPLASPRGHHQSDTVAQPAQRGSPSGSAHSKPQPQVRSQSLGGSFNITDPNCTSVAPAEERHSGLPVESHRGSISGAEQSPTATHPRLSPAGSVHSTSVPPAGVSGTTEASHVQHHNSSSDSTPRSTPAQSSHNFRGRISAATTPPALPPTNSRSGHHDSQSSMPLVHSVQDRTSGGGSPSELLMETLHRQSAPRAFSYSGTNRVPRREETLYRQSPPPVLSSRQNIPPAFFRSGTNSFFGRESPASSVRRLPERSNPRAGSPVWTQASGIPSHKSAFVTVSGENGTFSTGPSEEFEALRRERDTLAMELKQSTAHFQAELRRVKSRNEDLEQQILSIETVATLTKQDEDKARDLEQKLLEINRTLGERDEEISRLHKSVRSLERANQLLKEDRESLKTAHGLRLEDMNKINSDLQQELSDMRRRSTEAIRSQRDRDEVKITELKVNQNTLEQHVKRLEIENANLRKQLDQSSRKLVTVKAEKDMSDLRLSKAKSETDLSKKSKRFTSYDKHRYRDIEPAKTVSFAAKADASGFRTTRYTSLDTNYNRTYTTGSQVPIIMNGHAAVRPEMGKTHHSLSSSYQDRVPGGTHMSKLSDQRRRVSSLGDDSDASDDVEHGSHYGSHRRLTYSSESPGSSVASWEHDYLAEARNPTSAHAPVLRNAVIEGRTVPRRRRPNSYDGALSVLYSRDDYPTSSEHGRSLPLHCTRGAVDFDASPSSSYSTDSPLLTTAPYQTSVAAYSRDKLFSKPFAPSSSRDIHIGMELLVTRKRGQIGRGVVKYVGSLPGRKETFIGLELQPGEEGKHDGTLNGRRFFRCEPNRGIFVSFDKVVMCYG